MMDLVNLMYVAVKVGHDWEARVCVHKNKNEFVLLSFYLTSEATRIGGVSSVSQPEFRILCWSIVLPQVDLWSCSKSAVSDCPDPCHEGLDAMVMGKGRRRIGR